MINRSGSCCIRIAGFSPVLSLATRMNFDGAPKNKRDITLKFFYILDSKKAKPMHQNFRIWIGKSGQYPFFGVAFRDLCIIDLPFQSKNSRIRWPERLIRTDPGIDYFQSIYPNPDSRPGRAEARFFGLVLRLCSGAQLGLPLQFYWAPLPPNKMNSAHC